MENRFIQYELWKDCRNGCKFCFNKGQPDLNKINSLNFVLKKLDEDEVNDYNEVGFIGGEFFDTQLENKEVRELFYSLFEKISRMNKFDKIYITTSLLFDPSNYLIPFLDFLKSLNILDKVLLCTSFDLKYRFHTEQRKQLWEKNMLLMNQLFPQMKLHVEIILTQFFIDAVLNDTFNIEEFQEKFNARIDYIEPASGFYYIDKKEMNNVLPDFFPTKSSFMKFLDKVAIQSNQIDLRTFLSMDVRSNTVYCYLDGKLLYLSDRRKTHKGFADVQTDSKIKYEIGFIDSDIKMRKIVENLMKIKGIL